jgi:hypothetical protein
LIQPTGFDTGPVGVSGDESVMDSVIERRERLGGVLNYYERRAA